MSTSIFRINDFLFLDPIVNNEHIQEIPIQTDNADTEQINPPSNSPEQYHYHEQRQTIIPQNHINSVVNNIHKDEEEDDEEEEGMSLESNK